jgi:phosphoenolpyruvate carboxykinase (GTP)
MAMLPFCGYNMGDYFAHWLHMGKKIKKKPRIFHVNWFRQDKRGKFLWPGYGENLRVLEWIIDRCNGRVDAVETPIGYLPKAKDLNMTGLKISRKTIDKLLTIDKKEWLKDMRQQYEFFRRFGKRFPKELKKEYALLEERLKRRGVSRLRRRIC